MTDLRARLKELVRTHHVPGVSVAVLQDGEIETATAGIVNRSTKVTTTPDSLFQIGSITKVYTTTLMMQLADEGLVDLDAPVVTYVPELDLADDAAAKSITVRQLLTHTSGIDGDYFADFGRGDDCVERYVASLGEVGMIFPPGTAWSYSNAAFVLAGRVIEKLTGSSWDGALREKVLGPAGLREHASTAEEAIMFRTAAGHVVSGKKKRPNVARPWMLARSTGPAGATLCATARDLVRFAQIHLNDGLAANGTQILSPASVKAMQQSQYSFPGEERTSMGIGWILSDWPDGRVVWHNGGTIGQLAYLYTVPERQLALSILTNGANAAPLITAITKEVFAERFGMAQPDPERMPAEPVVVDLGKYAGTFSRHGVRIETEAKDDVLQLTMTIAILPGQEMPPDVLPLKPLNESTFAIANGEGEIQGKVTFSDFDAHGRPQYVFLGRIARRVSDRTS